METLIFFGVVVVVMVMYTLAAGNPLGHSGAFRRRRLMNWLPLGMTYAFLYMGRYNLTVAKNALGGLMPVEDFGIIFGVGTVTYGFSFLLNGPLTDKIGGRKAMLIGSFGAAVMNALLGVVTYLVLTRPDMELDVKVVFSAAYALNMYFQSFGAVAIVKVNSNWFHVRERGGIGGIFGVLISSGIYFAFDWGKAIVEAVQVDPGKELSFFQTTLRQMLVDSDVAMSPTWWVFFVPSAILFTFAVITLVMVRETPSGAGLEDIKTGDASESEGADQDAGPFKVLVKILTNPIVLTIAFIEFCSGVLRQGIMQWFLIFGHDFGLEGNNFVYDHWGLVLAVVGASGGMIAGLLSDKVFGSRRGPVAALLYAGMLIVVIWMAFVLLGFDPAEFSATDGLLLGLAAALGSLCVIGVHGMLSGTATMDFGGKKAAGTAVGIIDGFVYLGTAVQSFSLGYITKWDWSYWPVFLVPFAIIGLVLARRIWKAIPEAAGKSAH